MGAVPVYNIQQIIEMALEAYYAEIPVDAAVASELPAVLESAGYELTAAGTAYYPATIVSDTAVGSNIVGNAIVNADIVEEGGYTLLSTTEVGAETTAGGTGLLKGALSMEVSPVAGALAVAAACGYMWDEVNDHIEFWTDISDAILGVDADHPFGQIYTPESLRLKNGLEIALRARQDGGIGAYCERARIEAAINELYNKGAFNTQAEYRPNIESGGTYLVTAGGVDFNKAIGCINAPKPSTSVYEGALAEFNNHLTSADNAMIVNWWTELWSGGGSVTADIFVYAVPEGTTYRNFIINGDNISIDSALPNYKGHYTLSWNYYDGQHRMSGWATTGNTTQINGMNGTKHIFSSVNSRFIQPEGALEVDPTPGTQQLTNPDQLPQLFPDWMNDGFKITRLNPQTGEVEEVEYWPLTIPDFINDPQPAPGSQPETQTGKLPEPVGMPGYLPEYIGDYLKPNLEFPNFEYPEVPIGDTPLPFVPTNSMSSKLYTVYNPSNANLDSLGAFMWNTSIIQQLVELFTNNPMDAIISLHQIYATPSTGANKNIILGVLDSNVAAPVVTNQYVTIDCGTVDISEIYGDARDYTQVQTDIFLPFIGMRSLDCHDVIGCRVGVKFKIDVYTGSTLAEISVTKQGITQILYTFEGNCSVQIPLTAADRSRMIQGIVAATTGLVTGGVGAMAGAASAASLGGAMQTSIQKSSAFSGNAGAMGGKIPYIVITRQKSADASNFPKLLGYPTNKGIYLKDCRGYVKVKDIHIDIARATDAEKDMLYSVLKNGIVI